MVIAAIIGSLLAAGANLWPAVAEAARISPAEDHLSTPAIPGSGTSPTRFETAMRHGVAEPAPVTRASWRTAARPVTVDTEPHPRSPERAGRWEAPVGPIDPATRFDPPPLPWLPGHRGVDLASSADHAVIAVGSGTVVFAGNLAGRGVVSIDHPGGLRTTYEPVDPLVARGETVAAGQVIGHLSSGHASCPTAACLHLGLKRGAAYLDPLLLFGSGQVRLLPRPGEEAS